MVGNVEGPRELRPSGGAPSPIKKTYVQYLPTTLSTESVSVALPRKDMLTTNEARALAEAVCLKGCKERDHE